MKTNLCPSIVFGALKYTTHGLIILKYDSSYYLTVFLENLAIFRNFGDVVKMAKNRGFLKITNFLYKRGIFFLQRYICAHETYILSLRTRL